MGAAQGKEPNKSEHDMSFLKRSSHEWLRQGAPTGQKVLYVWDRAGIDFLQWYKWKKASGIYFITRTKSNMDLRVSGVNTFDANDPRNEGVIGDEIVDTSAGVSVRRVTFVDALSGTTYEFITSEMSLPPGIIAWLYQRRWDVEKVFDETKNRLFEKQAWATSHNAKQIQGTLIAITYNMMILTDRRFRQEETLPEDEKENKRRSKRREQQLEHISNEGRKPTYPFQIPPKCTQLGSKFIRWIYESILYNVSCRHALDRLNRIYNFF